MHIESAADRSRHMILQRLHKTAWSIVIVLVITKHHQAIIISRLAYALPAWGGFLSADNRNRLDGFLRRLYKCGFTVSLFTIEQLLCDTDNVLFRKVLNDGHCLHHLLPPVKTLSIQLRPASHNCQLPICKYMLYKRSFLVRCLFNCH